MNYLSAEGISKSYGIRTLFEEVTFHINEGDRIALAAKNGSGKTTLLKILADREKPDSGEVRWAKDLNILFLPQQDDFDENISAGECIFSHSNPVMNLIRRYEDLIIHNPSDPSLSQIMEEMTRLDAWKVEPLIAEILSKLKVDFLKQKIGELSGGQRKRILLAKFLIDLSLARGRMLLILDEPTNHLDIEMTEWLESYLNRDSNTLILVTHDRYFLDHVCTKVIEIDQGETYVHEGGYQNYISNKAARIENEAAQVGRAKNLYKKELEWMRRQPQARGTKSKSRIEEFYKTKERAHKKRNDGEVTLDMQMTRLGKKIIEMKEVSKRFGDKVILNDFSHIFGRKDKIGIIGKNGVGKTTFLKMIEGSEASDQGTIETGETLKIGYFKQEGIRFDEGERAIDFVKDLAESFPLSNGKNLSASQFMELFLFSPEQQYTHISKLSGGEKRRLQLLSVLFENPNFLILDEPTNDLDLPTLTVLEDFLNDFAGCLMVVSHDRYFMDKVSDELMIFEGEGEISWFYGSYSEYRELEQEIEREESSGEKAENPDKKERPKTQDNKLSFKEKKELESLEKELPKLEKLKKELTQKLSLPDADYDTIRKVGEKLEELIEDLEEKEMRWLELSMREEGK